MNEKLVLSVVTEIKKHSEKLYSTGTNRFQLSLPRASKPERVEDSPVIAFLTLLSS